SGDPPPMLSPLDLLTSDLLRYPLIIAVLIGLTAPVVGTYLVQKRLSLLGAGLGHVALTGVAVGWLVGAWTTASPAGLLAMPGALAASVIGALLIEYVREVSHTSSDVALAILLYGGIAGGVVNIQLAAVTGDEEFARGSGLPVRTVNVLIAVMAALTVTRSRRIVGALMVSALMIVPVAAAQHFVGGFTRTMRTAMAIAVVCSLGGLL